MSDGTEITKTDIAKELELPLDGTKVSSRSQAGRSLSYVEGWWVAQEMNNVFGHLNWSRETIECKEIWKGVYNGKPKVSYSAKVRVTVWGHDFETVVREGCGFGSGFGRSSTDDNGQTVYDASDAHEGALKEAETDAFKRAVAWMGWRFGMALYDKTQENVEHGSEQQPQPQQQQRSAPQPAGDNPEVIVKLKDGVQRRRVREMDLRDLEDALGLAHWRADNVRPGKWAEKNKNEALADIAAIDAEIARKGDQ